MPVPKRWLQYTKFGKQIPGTRFVALKCPLKQAICSNLPEEHRFTPQMFLSEMPSVAMLIDLTNTNRYYAPQELSGVRHVKVMCPGQQVPTSRVVDSFFDAVDSFLRSSIEGLIGVHCTHGVNRTGFLICKYLVSKMGFSPEQAARAFNESRGHQMERENYVKALQVPLGILNSIVGPEPVDLGLEKQLRLNQREPIDRSRDPVEPRDRPRASREPSHRSRGSREPRDRPRPRPDHRDRRPPDFSPWTRDGDRGGGPVRSRDFGPQVRGRDFHTDGRGRGRYGRDAEDRQYPTRVFTSRRYQQDWQQGRPHDYRPMFENLSWRREQRPPPGREFDGWSGSSRRDRSPPASASKEDDDFRKYQVLQ